LWQGFEQGVQELQLQQRAAKARLESLQVKAGLVRAWLALVLLLLGRCSSAKKDLRERVQGLLRQRLAGLLRFGERGADQLTARNDRGRLHLPQH
jgi:hypothetical protein